VNTKHPNPAGPVCNRCHLDTALNLTHLETGLPQLSLEPGQTRAGTHTQPNSKPPLQIAALSFTAQGGIITLLAEWVALLADHHRCQPPNPLLAVTPHTQALLKLLHTHHPWILSQTDGMAAPFVTEIAQAATDLANLLDPDRTWVPLPGRWTCPVLHPQTGSCDGLLKQHKGKWLVKCPTCGTTWEGDLELERLGRILGCDLEVTVAQAAVLASVTERTIYLWVNTGRLPATTQHPIIIDTRDLALTLSTRHDLGP
jgi:hypothetical protein